MDKESIEKSFDKWLIETAKKYDSTEDSVAVVVYRHLNNERYF